MQCFDVVDLSFREAERRGIFAVGSEVNSKFEILHSLWSLRMTKFLQLFVLICVMNVKIETLNEVNGTFALILFLAIN